MNPIKSSGHTLFHTFTLQRTRLCKWAHPTKVSQTNSLARKRCDRAGYCFFPCSSATRAPCALGDTHNPPMRVAW